MRQQTTALFEPTAHLKAPGWRRASLALAYAIACLAPVVPAAFYLEAARGAGVASGFPLDDSWIHAQYARTFVEGRPLEYVPGRRSVGTTSVLFDIVWAAATRITGEYVWTVHGVNLVLTAGVGAVLVALLLRFSLPPLTAGVGAALIVTSHPFGWSSLSGMETALASLLTAAAVLAHVTWRSRGGWRQIAAPVLMALAAISRPENLVLFPLSELDRLILHVLGRDRGPLGVAARRLGARVAAFAVVMLPYFAVNTAIHGEPVPSTYQAKIGTLALGADVEAQGVQVLTTRFRTSVSLIRDALAFMTWDDNLLLMVLAVPGVLVLVRPRAGAPAARSFLPILVLFGGMGAVGMMTLGVFFPGQSQRYLIQWIPLAFIYGVAGLDLVARGLCVVLRRDSRWVYGAVVAAVALADVLWLRSMYPEQVDQYVTSVKNINEMQVALGRWVNEHTPPEAVVATNDIGAIAFFGRRPVVDTIGLIDPEVVRIRRGPDRTGAMLAYLKGRGATYALLFPNWHPDLLLDPRLVPIRRVKLEDNVICGDDRMLVTALDWERVRGDPPPAWWTDEDRDVCRQALKLKKFMP